MKKLPRNKPDLSRLLDGPMACAAICAAFEYGESSEEDRTRKSWRAYNDPDGLISATLRHLTDWQNGEEFDPKSGLNHVASALCNLFMLCETNVNNVRKEDGEKERTSNKWC